MDDVCACSAAEEAHSNDLPGCAAGCSDDPRAAPLLRAPTECAESFFSVASAADGGPFRAHLSLHGDISLHQQHTAQAFLALAANRFTGGSSYTLDEPEAAFLLS